MHDKWAKNAAKDPCNWALMKDPVEAISYHTFPFVPDRTRVELVIANICGGWCLVMVEVVWLVLSLGDKEKLSSPQRHMSFSINVISILCTKDSRLDAFVAFFICHCPPLFAWLCVVVCVACGMWAVDVDVGVDTGVSLSGSRMNCYLLARILLLHCRMRKLNFVAKCKLASAMAHAQSQRSCFSARS